jgi:hypothetical protein
MHRCTCTVLCNLHPQVYPEMMMLEAAFNYVAFGSRTHLSTGKSSGPVLSLAEEVK